MAPPRQASVEAVDDDDDEIQEIPAPEQPQTQAPASAQPEMQAAEEPEWQVPDLSGYGMESGDAQPIGRTCPHIPAGLMDGKLFDTAEELLKVSLSFLRVERPHSPWLTTV